jgi:hypothetical protein
MDAWLLGSGTAQAAATAEFGLQITQAARAAAMPAYLPWVAMLRMLVGDPLASEIVFVETLPQAGYDSGEAWTTGGGIYFKWDCGAWQRQKLFLSDVFIRDKTRNQTEYSAGIFLLDTILARINPLDYVLSRNAGGQSLSFPTLSEIRDFFAARKAALQAQAETTGKGVCFYKRPIPVGDVYESADFERF